jgi:prepilin-type N-terminal cleavage/methylation domain-containing protein
MNIFNKSSKSRILITKGFTLVELMIVIAIFSIITTIAMADQGKLNSSVLLSNLAYDVALSVRQAQTYGIGVKYDSSSTDQGGGFGVYFDPVNTPDTIILYNHISSLSMYDSAEDVVEKRYQFSNQRGNKIAAVYCGSAALVSRCDQMSIVYKRPNPEPIMTGVTGGIEAGFSGTAYIVLKSADETLCRTVAIASSGQISVGNSGSPGCVNP